MAEPEQANKEQPNNRIRTNTKSCYEYLLSCTEPPIESPIKGKTIKQFHNENIKFAFDYATDEQAERIFRKYEELKAYFLSDKNKYRHELIVLKRIATGDDSLDNYKGEDLLRLYLYFNKFYRYQASFLSEENTILCKLFKDIDIFKDFKGIYMLEYKSEKSRCLSDVLNGEYFLSQQEAIYFDLEYETQDKETKCRIRKALSKCYSIGESIGLTDKELVNEFKNLYYFIIDSRSSNYTGKPFDIVDMYLTTNIQIEDFKQLFKINLPKEMMTVISRWFKDIYTGMFERNYKNPLFDSSLNIIYEINKPSVHIVKSFTNNSFGLYTPLDHNEKDLEKAHHVLCNLNKKYGVKYDHFTFMAVLRAVIWGEEGSYYNLGDKFKTELDKISHIVVKSEPSLTRRERNDA